MQVSKKRKKQKTQIGKFQKTKKHLPAEHSEKYSYSGINRLNNE